jgi:RNA polymerase I-specific transcription initiation factor RRN7
MSQHIEYHKFPRDEACSYENCRQRRYYLADGRRWCKEGHEQQGFRQVQEDEDDFNSQGRKIRRKLKEKDKVQRISTGREAVQLFLQCYQLILWKQVRWLVSAKNLPLELETVVRDLWAVRLRAVRALGDNNGGLRGEQAGISLSDSGEVRSGAEAVWKDFSNAKGKKRKIERRHNGLPTLVESLGLCYLGILLMRLPINLGELHRWVEKEELLFLQVASTYQIKSSFVQT